MNAIDKKALIEEKTKEIKKLREEIEELKGSTVKGYMKHKSIISGVGVNNPLSQDDRVCIHDIMFMHKNPSEMIRIAQRVFLDETTIDPYDRCVAFVCKRKLQQNMTIEQKKLVAKCADELVDVFEKYVKIANPKLTAYGKEICINQLEEKGYADY